jgi:hypothetical protein
VARGEIRLHVVRHAELGQESLEASALRREDPIAAAEAAEHGAHAAQLLDGLRHVAVEGAGDLERRARRVEEREAAAHAEADDAGPSRVDLRPRREPRARGLEVGDDASDLAARHADERPEDAQHARAGHVVEVDRERDYPSSATR